MRFSIKKRTIDGMEPLQASDSVIKELLALGGDQHC